VVLLELVWRGRSRPPDENSATTGEVVLMWGVKPCQPTLPPPAPTNRILPTSLREYLSSLFTFGCTWRSGSSSHKDGALRSPWLCCGWTVYMELLANVTARPVINTDMSFCCQLKTFLFSRAHASSARS